MFSKLFSETNRFFGKQQKLIFSNTNGQSGLKFGRGGWDEVGVGREGWLGGGLGGRVGREGWVGGLDWRVLTGGLAGGVGREGWSGGLARRG